MSKFSEFQNKFMSKCRSCGKSLQPGDTCYGHKDKTSGKWLIVCNECYSTGKHERLLDEETKTELPAEILDSVGTEMDTDSIGQISKRGRKKKHDSFVEEVKEETEEERIAKLPFDERIKHIAKWHIK